MTLKRRRKNQEWLVVGTKMKKKKKVHFKLYHQWNSMINPFRSEKTNLKRRRKNRKRLVVGLKRKKKMKLTFRAIPLMESHGQSVPKREDEPKKEKTKESKTVSIQNEKEKKR